MMIFYESTYDQKLNDQISKRIHRSSQKYDVTYYIFQNDIIIKELLKKKQKNKLSFEEKILIKMQKENEKNLIAKMNIEISVSMSKQNHVARFEQDLFKIQLKSTK